MKNYNVQWTEDAIKDFDGIIGYIYRENQSNAKDIYLKLKEQAHNLETFPFRGRSVPELTLLGFSHYRELIFKRWRLIYMVEENHVYVLLLLDVRQNLQDQLIQRILNY